MEVLIPTSKDKFGLAHDDQFMYIMSYCCNDKMTQASHYNSYTCNGCKKEWLTVDLHGLDRWVCIIDMQALTEEQKRDYTVSKFPDWYKAWFGVADAEISIVWPS